MQEIYLKLRDLLRNEEGATATEYAVMLALIIIVCIVAIIGMNWAWLIALAEKFA